MEREISNVARVCSLPGFRYVAFAPVPVVDAREVMAPADDTTPEPDIVAGDPISTSAVENAMMQHMPPPPVPEQPKAAPVPPAPIAAVPIIAGPTPAYAKAIVIARPSAEPFGLLSDIVVASSRRSSQAATAPEMPPLSRPATAAATPIPFPLLAEVFASIQAAQESPFTAEAPGPTSPAPVTRARPSRKRTGRAV